MTACSLATRRAPCGISMRGAAAELSLSPAIIQEQHAPARAASRTRNSGGKQLRCRRVATVAARWRRGPRLRCINKGERHRARQCMRRSRHAAAQHDAPTRQCLVIARWPEVAVPGTEAAATLFALALCITLPQLLPEA